MFKQGKYVCGEIKTNGMSVFGAIVFSEAIGHADVASLFVPGEIRSAGFFTVEVIQGQVDPEVNVYGESTGLKVKSIENDINHIRKALGLYV